MHQLSKPIVGLAGGVGSGKSTVAGILEALGGGVISSDKLGHAEINSANARRTLQNWWGPGVLTESGEIDRRKVASIIFSDPAQRHRLEAFLHPLIAIRRRDKMNEYQQKQWVKFIVIDSPLLYETDLDLECDAVIFVDAPFEVRRERSEKDRGWPPDELARREKSQYPLDMKRARADYTLVNDSDLGSLRSRVEQIVLQILSESNAV